jgi:hypothetical protein
LRNKKKNRKNKKEEEDEYQYDKVSEIDPNAEVFKKPKKMTNFPVYLKNSYGDDVVVYYGRG